MCDPKKTKTNTIIHYLKHKYTRALIHKYTIALTDKYTRALIHKYGRARIHKYTRALIYKYINAQIFNLQIQDSGMAKLLTAAKSSDTIALEYTNAPTLSNK